MDSDFHTQFEDIDLGNIMYKNFPANNHAVDAKTVNNNKKKL